MQSEEQISTQDLDERKGEIVKKPYPIILLLIILINFFLPRLMPGNPFTTEALDDNFQGASYSAAQIEKYKSYYEMDEPLPTQLVHYFRKILSLDLGYSLRFNQNVSRLIAGRLPWTLTIALPSLLFSTIIGIAIGAFSALRNKTRTDAALYFGMVAVSEIPAFLIGILLLFIFAAELSWFPLAGATSVFREFDSNFQKILDVIQHAVLPVTALTLSHIGGFYLLSRSSMLSILSKDYIKTAKGKGLGERRILWDHALKNAAPPIVAKIFMSLSTMLSGAVLVENVFSYPGLGRLMREAVMARDYVLIQGVFLCLSIIILVLSFLADFAQIHLDPRLREKGNHL